MDRDHPTDAERFSALWERHAGRVQAYAMRHVDRETAQEVVAETFLVAWRRLEDLPGEALPWLLVVARNTVRNHSRSVYRARQLHAALAALAPAGPTDPAKAVHERQMPLRALAAMAASDREAILLVAAAVLGCTEAAFKMRLSRARRRLAGAVEEGTAPTVAEPSGSGRRRT
ncbi:sigma-70 family RNA polymerase sigma factor [uncultured Cellulomonas sp.]|uniref:RNA polymerase sigma factor n=1 Tax=uncultured Cellulomonas sp. TaxID=189682 RepID=UPI0028EC7BEB|nr:sigma-70 family RNA polymerase sigma factor [uncultured Cellulomonas sp.]